jgi:serine/threonine protein kinase
MMVYCLLFLDITDGKMNLKIYAVYSFPKPVTVGSLQHYLETNHSNIPLSIRQKWCRQVVESISYIHHNVVIHSDLRPDGFLVYATTPISLDLWLCDFGGSVCDKLGIDGMQLPDSGFFDPNAEWVATIATDIFSVGSVLYIIVLGHWPYRDPVPFKLNDEYCNYNELVDQHFKIRSIRCQWTFWRFYYTWMLAEEVLQTRMMFYTH